MRNLLILAAALSATTAAQAATLRDDAAAVFLAAGDIYVDAAAPVSPDFAVSYASLSGGEGFAPKFALSLENGAAQLLFAETDSWTLADDHVLRFDFDLAEGSPFGDWLSVTLTFDSALADPFGPGADFVGTAAFALESGTSLPAVPVPAALPLLLGALGAGAAVLRRRA